MTNLIIDKDTLNKLIAKKITDEVVACLRDKHVPPPALTVWDGRGVRAETWWRLTYY